MRLTARIATLELAERFVIARSAQESADVVYVELEHGGETGYGEAAPSDRYGESAESALAFLEDLDDALDDDPFARDEIEAQLKERPGEMAAKAAIDAALTDLCGKLTGLPAWRFLGLRRQGPPTSWTIWLGEPDDMARRAEAATRFKRLKLKLGGGDGRDVDRVRAVREVTQVPLTVDINEAWTIDEALAVLPELNMLGVEYCEQPLPAREPGGAVLKERATLPIYVDEDCHTLGDVSFCAERAHGINIKLAKSGGMREAVRMAHAGRALGLGVMIGCMVESGLGIAAAAQIASLADHVDLDGNLLLREDPWPGVEFVDGVQLPSESPGLGVRQEVLHPR